MNIQIYQLATLLFYAVLAIMFWQIKWKWFRITLVAIGLIAFLVNPFRHMQPGVASLEMGGVTFEVPEKVIISRPSFEERQSAEYNALKRQSEERKHEIHN